MWGRLVVKSGQGTGNMGSVEEASEPADAKFRDVILRQCPCRTRPHLPELGAVVKDAVDVLLQYRIFVSLGRWGCGSEWNHLLLEVACPLGDLRRAVPTGTSFASPAEPVSRGASISCLCAGRQR